MVIRVATCLWLSVCFIPLPARADLEQELSLAEAAIARGAYTQALDDYLGVLPQLAAATPPQREALLRGLLDVSRELVQRDRLEPALRGLVALLAPTRDQPLGPDFSAEVRIELEEVCAGMIFRGEGQLAVAPLQALMADGPGTPLRWAFLARAYLDGREVDRAT